MDVRWWEVVVLWTLLHGIMDGCGFASKCDL
jgi:hypothetical protein